VKESENAEIFAEGSGFSLNVESFEVLEAVGADVSVKLSRFFFPDSGVPTS